MSKLFGNPTCGGCNCGDCDEPEVLVPVEDCPVVYTTPEEEANGEFGF